MNTAIITGAAQGVGLCIAESLAQRNYRLVLSDIDTEKGTAAASQLNLTHGEGTAAFFACDLSDLRGIDALLAFTVETMGGFSVLINNAGYLRAPFLALSAQDIQDIITVNQTAPIYATQQAIKYWDARDQGQGQGQAGCVVTVTSSSSFKTYASIAPYGAAKAGAAMFTFAAGAFYPRVRVNAVAPTAIATGFDRNRMRVETDRTGPGYTPEEEMRAMGLKRLQPQEVADAVVRCVEDEGLYGKVLYLDAVEGIRIHDRYT
ncbi:hypothetical protein BJX61DRAFT_550023 [Aspergillus egyptiacus]|nr:hypothetical protein BJX61DRAFT_550023 [Aspergillus egyptiacus]